MISVERLEQHQANIVIIGLGYVGLPLAVEFALKGFCVSGIDQNEQKIKQLNEGANYIADVDSNQLKQVLASKHFVATTDYAVVKQADVVILCVPTPLNKTWEPDMSYIISATEGVAAHMGRPCLVVLESTTYPGTTDEVILPLLSANNRQLGEDFFLAFSPERVDPGNRQYKTKDIPKIVGGADERSSALALALYRQVVKEVVPVSSPKVAEMAKLLENTFRTVNIGLINELALMSDQMGIDVWEAIDAAATKPFGFMPFYPGPGLGGHCLPIDPLYLAWKAKLHNFETRFIHLASRINRSMPQFVVQKVTAVLNQHSKSVKGSNILVLGVAYKPNVDDLRESPALDIMAMLLDLGARVQYHDPYIAHLREETLEMDSVDLTEAALQSMDCVVVLTNHSCLDYSWIMDHAVALVDTRNATKGIPVKNCALVKL